MASVKLMTPQNKPKYFKITANVMVNGNLERRYSRFDFDPQKLRTLKSRTAAAMAAAVEFEKSEQEKVDQEDSDANKSFAEVAEEYISDTKARLAPSARLRGNFDSRKNKANTTRNKENYLTFVSILMSNPDIGVATVAAEAGHAQPSTTLMIYTQQYKKRQESIRNQLSRELYGT